MPDNAENQYTQASLATADKLKNQAHTLYQKQLTRLSLQEVDEAVNIVAKMVPAGNVPGVVLNGLARLTGRRPPPQTVERDVNLLFKGVEQVLDKAAFGAFFAGPAAVIWGYQHLLKLAGKTPDDAFPDGTWQFYVDYALREDTARHANETHGFDTLLTMHDLQLSPIDRTVAWVLTAMQIVQQYDDLLANEWRERVHTHIADEVSDGRLQRVYGNWARQRPYGRRDDAGRMTYPAYRRHKFDTYMQEEILPQLSSDERAQWQQRRDELEASALPAYQAQMSIHSYLEPQSYHEEHKPVPIGELSIGVIHRGRYYLVPLQRADGQPNDVHGVRSQVAAIFSDDGDLAADVPELTRLASIQRTALPKLTKQLSDNARTAWQQLRHAPILVNADQRPAELSLAELRQAERGIGDHALTIFDTGKTIVFDQSHIYFDGAWGAALAEIMTNEALSWARYLASLEPSRANVSGVMALNFDWQPSDEKAIAAAPTIVTEVSAESSKAHIDALLGLRKLFKQRSDLLRLTVNDLLVLYRAIHAATYKPSPVIEQAVAALLDDDATRAAGQAVQAAWKVKRNPAILIPIDASQTHPAERLYPMSFDVPIYDLDLIALHERTRQAQRDYKAGKRDPDLPFDKLQRDYLEVLAGFGDVMSRAKEIALAGEGTSSGSIRLLAHMPRPIQQLMNEIPSRIDVLNDIIKGREVFSNVGAVAPTSTLTRFITAKDDNEQKTLAWGVMTDAERTMVITLRDFRPHVRELQAAGKTALAQRITQDYLDSYVRGLNQYIAELRDITYTSRQTRLT